MRRIFAIALISLGVSACSQPANVTEEPAAVEAPAPADAPGAAPAETATEPATGAGAPNESALDYSPPED